jgi:hypothetical protein
VYVCVFVFCENSIVKIEMHGILPNCHIFVSEEISQVLKYHEKKMNLQDSQCTYNVTFRSVRSTIVVVEKQ